MKNVSLLLCALMVFSSTLLSNSNDSTVTIYGPQKFERSHGNPTTVTKTFPLPSNVVPPYSLIIENGFCDDDDVTSATITLNGVQVVSPSDFNRHQREIVKTITLAANNTVKVKISGKPNTFLILSITGKKAPVDHTPPQLTISSPATGTITNTSSITVSGTVTDQSAVTLTINNVAVQVNANGTFSGQVNLTEGSNTITVVAKDANNNQTVGTRTVIRDSTPPALTVSQPSNGSITNQSSVTVSGTVSDANAITLKINGTVVTVNAQGAFSSSLPLNEGLNTITVLATDAAGNATSVIRTVRKDSTPPTLTVAQPVEGTITNSASITVSGSVFDSTTVTLLVNGTHVNIGANGSYTTQVSLNEGHNTISVSATDAAGNTTTLNRHVIKDTTPPSLTVSNPVNGTVTNQSSISVAGTTSDSTTVTVKVNGISVSVGSEGSFSTSVALAEGNNVITVSATDAGSNNTTVTRTVIRDDTPPTLTVTNPVNGVITKQATIAVAGSVHDSTAVTLTMNGIPVTIGGAGSFNTQFSLVEGINTITLVATDAAGNFSTITRTVRKDATAPTLSISSPIDGTTTNESTILVEGTVYDSTAVTVTINGTTVSTSPAGAFSYPFSLVEGTNVITVIATDAAGNSTTVSRTVHRSSVPPAITVTSPLNGTITNQSAVTVSGTVTSTNTVLLAVNGASVTIGTGGSFSTSITLVEGTNTITISATDGAGNTSSVVRTVYKDSIPPSISLTQPTQGFVTAQPSITVQGLVSDSTAVTVTANGVPVSVGTGGAFSSAVSLTEGRNTITVVATDAAGNSSTVTRTVIKDSTPPILTVSSPADGSVTNQPSTTVSGTVSDSTTVALTINGVSTAIGGNGTFSSSLALIEGANAITLVATDAAGNKTTVVRNVRLDTAPPQLVVTAPQNNSITNQKPIIVSGTVSDVTTVSLTINGNAVPIVNGLFSTSYTLTEGLNTFIIVATDAAGNSSSQTRSVRLDTTPPTLTITSPVNGITTNQLNVTITGTVADSTDVAITINGTPVQVGGNGAFTGQVTLSEGLNSFTVVATDAAGNSSTVTRTIIRDTTPPTLTVVQPLNGMITKQDTTLVVGTATDSTALTLTINGASVPVGGNGQFSFQLSLVEGSNLLSIVATDAAGNISTVTRLVIKDSKAPTLTVVHPVDGMVTKQDTTLVDGTVTDSTAVTLTINGILVSVGGNGQFSFQLPLVEGSNLVSIVATDAAGNVSTVTRSVIKDSKAPTLTVADPANGLITRQSSIVVDGTVIDSTAVTMTINGTPVTGGVNGTFSYVLLLNQGRNNISVVATDAAGNLSSEDLFVIRDTAAPTLSVTSPVNGVVTNQSSVTVSGTVIDSSAVALTINGDSVLVTNGSFSTSVLLSEGINTIAIVATDAAGNSSSQTRSVRLDTIPPVITITSPVNGSTVYHQTITIAGSVADSTSTTVTINGNPVQVGTGGVFTFQTILSAGLNTFIVVAKDTAGNSSTVTRTVTYSTLPPDPATVAPPLDTTIATNPYDETKFLYSGPDSIQKGVASGTIVATRVAVIRGKVLANCGTPLSGVKITIVSHPEFGYTSTRTDGMFDMAVNGGGLLTLGFAKAGFIPAQRQVNTPWMDFVFADSVHLIAADSIATTITGNIDSVQAAQTSIVSDVDGTRHSTIIFSRFTNATMTFSNGTSQALPSFLLRGTEYGTGAECVRSLPGTLPPTSALGYGIDLAADEAINQHAKSVTFDKPFAMYTSNFLAFSIGSKVPAAYFDSTKGIWIPINNGRVVKIVSITGGMANLDVTGSGTASGQSNLDSLGISNDERQTLALLFSVGQSFMRVQASRLGPWSYSWPFGPPLTAKWPSMPSPTKQTLDKDCTTSGSIIGIQDQTLGEVLPVTGTPFSIYYKSDRVPGRVDAYSLNIPLTGATIPPGLNRVYLVIQVEGQEIDLDFAPSPNLSYNFVWDGKDAYGRNVQGKHPVTTQIGYNYNATFQVPTADQSFGNTSGNPLSNRRSYTTTTLWQNWSGLIGLWDETSRSLGSWSLNIHHLYDAVGKVIHFGDGNTRSSDNANLIVTTVAGNGVGNYNGDSIPASQAHVAEPAKIVFAPDGSLYFCDPGNSRIRKIDANGIITTVAGNGEPGYNGDSIAATSANLYSPNGLALGPDGSFYFTDNSRIRKVSPSGLITTFAGNGAVGYSGDGGLATSATLDYPSDVAVSPDGSVYISDAPNYRIRRVNPNGIITTVAGNGNFTYNGTNIPATSAAIHRPPGIAIGKDGSLYFGAPIQQNYLRKVGPDGIIRTIAGTGNQGFSGDCGPGVSADIDGPWGVAVDKNDNVVFPDEDLQNGSFGTSNERIRRLSSGGIVTTIAGNGTQGYNGDATPATGTMICLPSYVALAPDGSVYFTENQPSTHAVGIRAGNRVRKISKPFPQFSLNTNVVPSEDGSELYVFDYAGRHQQTLDALTGVVKYDFYYDAQGRLTYIRDIDSLYTTIVRDTTGKATAIVSPYGQTTYLYINNNGYLDSLTNPAGETHRFTYDDGGLLKTMRNAKNLLYQMTYDSLGRLTKDQDPLGGFKALSRTEIYSNSCSTCGDVGFQVTMTTALGKKTTYRVERVTPGGILETNTDENGQITLTSENPNGTTTITSPDSTVTTVLAGPDPRFGMMVPVDQSKITRRPSGLTSIESHGRLITQMSGLQVVGLRDSTIFNGRVSREDYSGTARTITSTSPSGRTKVIFLDMKGRVIKDSTSGITSATNTYNAKGLLITSTQGTRTTRFTYDNDGRLQSVQDPMLRISGAICDSVGRPLQQILSDGSIISYSYDANSNTTSLTPPAKPLHSFNYDDVDQKTAYNPPALPIVGSTPTGYQYNLDKQNVTTTYPDSTKLIFVYDTTGGAIGGNLHIKSLTFDRGTISYNYDVKSGLIIQTISADHDTLLNSYDGTMPIKEEWRGAVRGFVTTQYDSNFRVIGQKVNGGDSIGLKYNVDNQLTKVGTLSLTYNSSNGLLTADTLGNVTTAITYSSLGEISEVDSRFSGSSIYTSIYTRDSLGRITVLSETIQGQSRTFKYHYNLAGRLEKVWRNDTLISQYVYDSTGNRLMHITPTTTDSGSYDVQDRLVKYSNTSFSYTNSGYLQTMCVGTDSTKYVYDALGNLRKVTLPNGDVVEYSIDANNRRTGKKVNGTMVSRWLYENQLRPVAELDSNNIVIARYIYANNPNVPDYVIKNGVLYRILTDHLGSVRLAVNFSTGVVVSRFDYDEYGNVLFQIDSLNIPFGYAGGLYDPETKLVRFGARDYDAHVGRWIMKDPISFEAGDVNLYAYVKNNPINSNDPEGKVDAQLQFEEIVSAILDLATYHVQSAQEHANAALADVIQVDIPIEVKVEVTIVIPVSNRVKMALELVDAVYGMASKAKDYLDKFKKALSLWNVINNVITNTHNYQ
jgi:RHS repeat-associated protein